ncbi:MAG: zinc ABC transporter substrate-binding protein [Treponema sp.]|nr:zinc ABC transporter substrate-binding protein [Candidatus Treponema equifaecale]
MALNFIGCKKSGENSASSKSKINVVATIFPFYDWTKNISAGSEKINLELLVKNGVDLHSFQPSAGDIIKISSCDVLIYVGGESDSWVDDVLKNPVNKNQKVIKLMEVLSDSVKEEEIVEGMVVTTDSTTEETGSITEDDEIEYDEHVWLSLVNAKICCEKIAEVLATLDENEKSIFEKNLSDYTAQIDGVWKSLFSAENISENQNAIIICDRFPFRYMVDELGIKYFAAFAGCSAETEASFETIAFLSGKVQELGLNRVYVTESSDKKIARTVIKNAGLTENECKIIVLNSMQNVTMAQAQNGISYIEIMKKNFEELK